MAQPRFISALGAGNVAIGKGVLVDFNLVIKASAITDDGPYRGRTGGLRRCPESSDSLVGLFVSTSVLEWNNALTRRRATHDSLSSQWIAHACDATIQSTYKRSEFITAHRDTEAVGRTRTCGGSSRTAQHYH